MHIAAEASFDSCTTNAHTNKQTNPSDITEAEKKKNKNTQQNNYRAQVSRINLTLVLCRHLKPGAG